jgi:translation initiation factor 4A
LVRCAPGPLQLAPLFLPCCMHALILSLSPRHTELDADGQVRSNYDAVAERFEDMGLDERLLRGVFAAGFEKPSAIQQRAIGAVISGRDVIAQAQSGTGKTGAFAIGVLQRVDFSSKATQALILAPTRELAAQIYDVVAALGKYTPAVVHACLGGTSVREDAAALRRGGVHVVVGTPGRVHALMDMGALHVAHLRLLVLDEADQMLEHGFQEQMQTILSCEDIPRDMQVALFSASLCDDTLAITRRFMQEPALILVKKEVLTLRGIRQHHIEVEAAHKLAVLLDLWEMLVIVQAVVFVNSRRQVEWLAAAMRAESFPVSAIHSDMPPEERRHVMQEFRHGASRVLISTDLLARGIDVQQVSLVVNFDMPLSREVYLHRIGRAGRNGRVGAAISLVSARERHLLTDVEAYYSTEVSPLPNDLAEVNDAIGGGGRA